MACIRAASTRRRKVADIVNVALIHDWLTGMRGGEKCLEIFCRRFPTAPLFTLLHVPGSTSPTIQRMPITTSALQRLPAARRYYRYLLPAMPAAIRRMTLPPDVDMVLSFSHAVAKNIRVPEGIPHVCYCFTPMRYAWHMREAYFGTQHDGASGPTGAASWRDLIKSPVARIRDTVLDRIRTWDRDASSGVTRFVACSQTVSRRIFECYGRSSDVVYPPIDTEFFTPENVKREDYYLVVSALVPYKRIELAIEACRRLGRRLVIIGHGPQRRRLSQLAGPDVQLLGWQSNETIRNHLRRCRALLFPGEEDFGIVPLEAQACGAAVIALDRGGATETVVPPSGAQPGTGRLFSDPSSESLAEAILDYERDPDSCCPRAARRQAQRFNARNFETGLMSILAASSARRLQAA
jgi:glycosyltransferase involved in cell wall biosynthesis